MKNGVWASKDRRTVWQRSYEFRHTDGTVEVYTVDRVAVLHPTSQQIHIKPASGAEVIPASRILVNRKTGKHERHAHYYTFGQSFHGGPGAKGDMLGGFCTGQFVSCYEATAQKNMRKLCLDGFRLVKQV